MVVTAMTTITDYVVMSTRRS